MTVRSAKSNESASDGDTSSREGRLANTSVPELLARAYRVEFSGTLVLEPADAAPSNIRFLGGAIVDASGPFKTAEHEWEVLGQLLPSDSIDFAMRHAGEYGLEPFAAVEQLLLLPSESLGAARQALSVRCVQALCGLRGDVRYAFVAPAEGHVELGLPLEPLALLMACFATDSQKERAARSIATFEYATLSADPERARRVLATLHGPLRGVLEAIVLSPNSVHSLRERNLLPPDELVAAVCALWITRVVTVRISGQFGVTTGQSVPPRGTSSMPPFSPPTSMMPPRRDSGFQRAVREDAQRGPKELAMVLKVEEAWLTANADPSRAQQITGIVLKAVSVFPKNPRLRYYLSRLHIQANRLDEAAKELTLALELDPQDPEIVAELAKLRASIAAPHH